MKNFKLIFSLFSVILLLLNLCACIRTEDAPQKEISFDMRTEYESISVDVLNGYAKIDLINPGLNTADITVTLFSLKTGNETARVKLGDGCWSTGCLDNGFFAVDEQNKRVYLYDRNGELTLEKTIDSDARFFVTSYVSADGKHLMFAEPDSCKIYITALYGGKKYFAGKFTGYANACGYRDNSFFICSGTGGLLQISLDDMQLITTFDNKDINFVSMYGGTGINDDLSFKYIDARKSDMYKNIRYLSVDEVTVAVIPYGIVSISSEADISLLRLYSKTESIAREIKLDGDYICSASAEDSMLFICTKTDIGFRFMLSDIEKATALNPSDFRFGESDTAQTDTVGTSKKSETAAYIIENIPIIPQFPKYPTGCESVSAVMALRHAGYDIDVDSFIDKFLPKSIEFSYADGTKYGPDPNEYFIGNPRTGGSYGCFPSVIEKAISYFSGNRTATRNVSGEQLSVLCEEYVSRNIPIMVWATVSMTETYKSAKWVLPSGETFYWPKNEHCMLLIGYDDASYYFNDPYSGKQVKYGKALSEKRYSELGSQALVIGI